MRFRALLFLGITFIVASEAFGQFSESDLRIFGYFQNTFIHQTEFIDSPEENSFSVQQLNLFFQKDLARHWRTFVNFELLNNFSSSRQWGAFNLEEAWVRYRSNEKFNLKMGLHIPIFNHLNTIKNRTPLLPYVIRPLVYETSFSEFIAVEEFTPARAFVQAYGFLTLNKVKLDYALYLGNSPNINSRSSLGQTGVDTTNTFLIGGRLGIRYGELKVGLSATRDNTNILQDAGRFLGGPANRFEEIPRVRFGGDLSYHLGKFSLESEFIIVNYYDDTPEIIIDKEFYYATLGYQVTEQLFVYGSYWLSEEDFTQIFDTILATGMNDIKVPTVGVAFNINDRIRFKGQFAPVDFELDTDAKVFELANLRNQEFNHYSVAVSIFF
ncbi:hypothetical protein GWO43_07005 [candidate division KSB1 bacterium]|nr:hypothetical protein [candidate division KSB1 bacterium]NIR72756.1 hypothetical protein [candidate division KSB1 bacterium]NIS23712.1 hypothetical protein [candidate division KSB1 bacterium]NIT70632.1 hypothetical protein [candidate division KSB1 bacterium]NIU24360.1 hypothetical protein [candidate division KSB1 bacterium]